MRTYLDPPNSYSTTAAVGMVNFVLQFDHFSELESALEIGYPNCQTVEQAKQKYHQIALAIHPDRNSDPRAGEAFQFLKGTFDEVVSFFESIRESNCDGDCDCDNGTSESGSEEEDELRDWKILTIRHVEQNDLESPSPTPGRSSPYPKKSLSQETLQGSVESRGLSDDVDGPTPCYEFRCPFCKTKLRLGVDKITGGMIDCKRCQRPLSWRDEVEWQRKRNLGIYASERLYRTGLMRMQERGHLDSLERERRDSEYKEPLSRPSPPTVTSPKKSPKSPCALEVPNLRLSPTLINRTEREKRHRTKEEIPTPRGESVFTRLFEQSKKVTQTPRVEPLTARLAAKRDTDQDRPKSARRPDTRTPRESEKKDSSEDRNTAEGLDAGEMIPPSPGSESLFSLTDTEENSAGQPSRERSVSELFLPRDWQVKENQSHLQGNHHTQKPRQPQSTAWVPLQRSPTSLRYEAGGLMQRERSASPRSAPRGTVAEITNSKPQLFRSQFAPTQPVLSSQFRYTGLQYPARSSPTYESQMLTSLPVRRSPTPTSGLSQNTGFEYRPSIPHSYSFLEPARFGALPTRQQPAVLQSTSLRGGQWDTWGSPYARPLSFAGKFRS